MAATTSGGRCHIQSYALAQVDAGRFKADVLAFIHAGPAPSNNEAAAASSRAAALYPTAVCFASESAHRPPGWLIAQT
jgi:hypothetical protein